MPRLGALSPDARAHPHHLLAQEPLSPPLRLLGNLLPNGFGLQVGGVIARMRKAPAICQLNDPRGNIEEVAVMRDKDDGARELVQKLLQPRMDSASRWLVGSSAANPAGPPRHTKSHAPLFAAGTDPNQAWTRRCSGRRRSR